MKLRAPAGCTSVSHGGRTLTVAADGSLEVEDHVAAALAAHGFAPCGNETPSDIAEVQGDRGTIAAPDIDSLKRPALFALLREKGARRSADQQCRAARRGVPRAQQRAVIGPPMPSPFDLVALADVKSWLDVTADDDDELLGGLITQVSRATLAYLDRAAILPATYVETRDGGNDSEMMLRQWPATAISALSIDGVAIAAAPPLIAGGPRQSGYVLEAADLAPPGHMQRLALRGKIFSYGIQNVTITYNAGYQVTAEVASVPASTPYEILAQAPYGDWASDAGVAYANGTPLTAVGATPSAGQYSVAEGTYTFAAADAGAAVALTYGYVPADLCFAAMDWVAELYSYRGRIGQQSKSLGGQETISFIVKDVPAMVAAALQPYHRVVQP
jgi:hypothetical protein